MAMMTTGATPPRRTTRQMRTHAQHSTAMPPKNRATHTHFATSPLGESSGTLMGQSRRRRPRKMLSRCVAATATMSNASPPWTAGLSNSGRTSAHARGAAPVPGSPSRAANVVNAASTPRAQRDEARLM